MLSLKIQRQPDDETCGATCLHAVYQYYGFDISLEQVIEELDTVETGGTIAPLLGLHALKNNFKVELFTYNLDIFDPSWFKIKNKLLNKELIHHLETQLQYKTKQRFVETSQAYMDYLKQGGIVSFKDLTANLLKKYLVKEIPILTGLSCTYLYQTKRERVDEQNKVLYDDIQGVPAGHFVILAGYKKEKRKAVVADPYDKNPIASDHIYEVPMKRLLNAILLGVYTYDATLLLISPKS